MATLGITVDGQISQQQLSTLNFGKLRQRGKSQRPEKQASAVVPTAYSAVPPIFRLASQTSKVGIHKTQDGDTIIVSMTSWTKRIGKVVSAAKSILSNTLLPYKLVINLSLEEFPRRESQLPYELRQFVQTSKLTQICWVEKNTKPYKKLMPSLDRFPDAIIITVDDDIIYPQNFIYEMYSEYLAGGKQNPVTGGVYKWDDRIYSHHGAFSLVTRSMFGPHLWDLYENLYMRNPDVYYLSDILFTYAMILNGKRYRYASKLNMTQVRNAAGNDQFSISNTRTPQYRITRDIQHQLIRQYISDNYGTTYGQMVGLHVTQQIAAKDDGDTVIVNFTTWKKRDKNVPVLLRYFKRQTLKPDKIICWLSQSEYNGSVPESIQYCVDNGMLDEVRFVDGNTYGHKRYETFKYNMDAYNIFIDDDLYYPADYVETLYKACKANPDCVCCYYSRREIYDGVVRTYGAMASKASLANRYFSGLAGFSPNTFPAESFKYAKYRDKYSQKCDDSWVNGWLLKKRIKIYGINQWGRSLPIQPIQNTQESGIFETHNGKHVHGVMQGYINIANVLYLLGLGRLARKIWPHFDVNFISKCKE